MWTERVVETWQLPWSPMDSSVLDAGLVECLDSWLRMQWYAPSLSVTRQVATDAVVCTFLQCLDSWLRMQWYAPSHSVSTAGYGCSGMYRLSLSHDSWYWNALDSRSSEVSVLISGRLRRMVSEVFGKHFGELCTHGVPRVPVLSLVSPCHCSCICMSLSCHICLLRLVSSTCHPYLLDR